MFLVTINQIKSRRSVLLNTDLKIKEVKLMEYILKPKKEEEQLVTEMSEVELQEVVGGFSCFFLKRCFGLSTYWEKNKPCYDKCTLA